MGPFRFKLEKILDYRGVLEEKAKQAFAEAKRVYAVEERRMLDLREALRASAERLCAGGLSVDELWLERRFGERLKTDLEQSEARLMELARGVNRARLAMVERSKDRKLLEKLKENQARNHARESFLHEQKILDETVVVRRGRDGVHASQGAHGGDAP